MKTWLRCGAVLAGLTGLAFPTVAAASPGESVPSADHGYALHDTHGSSHQADIITVSPGQDESGAVLSYSLEPESPLDVRNASYENDGDTGTKGMSKVRWILRHGYPGADAGKLADLATADLAGDTDAGTVAYAAAQAAIWSSTSDFKLDRSNPTDEGAATDAAVLAITDHLSAYAEPVKKRNLDVRIDGPDSGKADGSIGPYTATGPKPDGKLSMSAKGGSVVNSDGDKIDEIGAGEEFFVIAGPGASEVTITAQAVDAPAPGQVLSADDSCALVLAEYGSGGASSDLDVEIANTTDSSQLPVTGTPTTAVAATGGGLALAGVALMVFATGRGRRADLVG